MAWGAFGKNSPSYVESVAPYQRPQHQGTTAFGTFAPQRFCTNCGYPLAADHRFCPSCGRAVVQRPSRNRCACGAMFVPKERFCSSCGTARPRRA